MELQNHDKKIKLVDRQMQVESEFIFCTSGATMLISL